MHEPSTSDPLRKLEDANGRGKTLAWRAAETSELYRPGPRLNPRDNILDHQGRRIYVHQYINPDIN